MCTENIITYLSDIKRPGNIQVYSVGQALADIQSGKWRVEVEAVRELYGTDGYKPAKENLPAFAFAGTFNGICNNDNFQTSSNMFLADIDKIKNLEATKQLIINSFPEVISVFISPSGHGLKVLLKLADGLVTNAQDQRQVFTHIAVLFEFIGVSIDLSCIDVRRLCFVAHDPEIYVNWDVPALTFELKEIEDKAPKATVTAHGHNKIISALEVIDADEFDRSGWISMLASIKKATGGSNDGFDIADHWSSYGTQGKYVDREHVWDAWQSISLDGRVNEDYLFAKAREHGWIEKIDASAIFTNAGINGVANNQPVTNVAPGSLILPSDHLDNKAAGAEIFRVIGETRTLFFRGNKIFEIGKSGTLEQVTASMFISRLDGYGVILRHKVGRSGGLELSTKRCSESIAKTLLNSQEAAEHLPNIEQITTNPIINPEGVILQKGYHDCGTFVLNGEQVPDVPLKKAVLALKELLTDFDFISPGDYARAIASLITPALVLRFALF